MGLWNRIRERWRRGKERDEEFERKVAIDQYLKERDRYQREQTRSPRLPPRGDRG